MKWAVVLLLLSAASATTVCVDLPLQPLTQTSYDLQAEVGRLFQARGFEVDCARADLMIRFYYLNGGPVDDWASFSVRYATAPGLVLGTVTTSRLYGFGAWTFTLRHRGEISTLSRVTSGSLKGGVKSIAKAIQKGAAK